MKPFTTPSVTCCWKELHLKCGRVLDLSLKTSAYTETSPVSCENQSFFLLFRNMVAFIKSLYYFLLYDEVLFCSLLDICYHCLVFMDPVNGYLASFIKNSNQFRLCMFLVIFVIPVFYFGQYSGHLLMFN